MYQLYQEQLFATSREELWEFISRPENLDDITPPEMEFTIASEVPPKMYPGLLVSYKVKLPLLGSTDWITEIKHIIPGKQFVDEQRVGPYAFWYHYHRLEETAKGINMIDRASYQPPYGILGKAVNGLMIRRQLDAIFEYRRKVLDKRYN